jgi:hypothetical protein
VSSSPLSVSRRTVLRYAAGLSAVGGLADQPPTGRSPAGVATTAQAGWSQATKLVPEDGSSSDPVTFYRDENGEVGVRGVLRATAEFDRGEIDRRTVSVVLEAYNTDGRAGSPRRALVNLFVTAVVDASVSEKPSASLSRRTVLGYAAGLPVAGTLARRSSTRAAAQSTWAESARLVPEDGDSGDRFGAAVALADDGETALVGAPADEDRGDRAGAAYVLAAADRWSQRAKLVPEDGERDDRFGEAVALSADGTTALVGAPGDDVDGTSTVGSAYVFVRRANTWRERTKLTATDGDDGDRFGEAVALSADGETALLGAVDDEDPNDIGAGSAYVFEEDDGAWRERTKLAPADGDPEDAFGAAVALADDGETALVAAPVDEDPNGPGAGSAYVFEETDGTWRARTKLTHADGDSGDAFGGAVALSADGTTATAGAPGDADPNGSGAGAAYVLDAGDGTWDGVGRLVPADGDGGDAFGGAVALSADGETALLGAAGTDPDGDPDAEGSGAAYVFGTDPGREVAKLVPPDVAPGDRFGRAVALSADGETALLAAPSGRDGEGSRTGAVSVFTTGSPEADPLAPYRGDDGVIGVDGVLRAIGEFNRDEIGFGRVLEVISAFNTDG